MTTSEHLSSLPPEVFDYLLALLDLKSIFNLSLTNHSISASRVHANEIYHLLTTDPTAKHALNTLRQTTLLTNHTLATITKSLRTTTCTCCHRNVSTPYIYLPTFTRTCLTCVHYCPTFEIIPIELASKTFGLEPSTLEHISIRTIPGIYQTQSGLYSHKTPVRLVNVAQARAIAIELKGAEALDKFMASLNADVNAYHMPLATMGYFITPYTKMGFDECEVRMSRTLLGGGKTVNEKLGPKGKGVARMACEVWPFINPNTGRVEIPGGREHIVKFRVESSDMERL